MSRFDHSDPGTDPDYCNGLAADDEVELVDDRGRVDGYCLWCGFPLVDEFSDYCSLLCAVAAKQDSK